jgi:hypothetical protein
MGITEMTKTKKNLDNLAIMENSKKLILERLQDMDYVLIWDKLERDLIEVNMKIKLIQNESN